MTEASRPTPRVVVALLTVLLIGAGSPTAATSTGAVTPAAATPIVSPGAKTPRSAGSPQARTTPGATELLQWSVVERYPHDRGAFTQGLLVRGDTMYESTGIRGSSSVRIVDIASGAVRRQVDLPTRFFGEGLAMVDDHLVQLTWTSGVARVYSLPDLALVTEHRYDGQGWGLCFDGENLVMSDGSHRLYVRDPETFALLETIEVFDGDTPVPMLNELECVGRHIYANVWRTWRIVRIVRTSGRVDATLDLSDLLSVMEKQALVPDAVLNGIAYDEATDTFLLTGKLWPRVHRIRLLGR